MSGLILSFKADYFYTLQLSIAFPDIHPRGIQIYTRREIEECS
jgi:hypothetical protein